MNLLFVCNQNKNRSLTAQRLFDGRRGDAVRSAGLYSDEAPVTSALMAWADVVFVFEEAQLLELRARQPRATFEKRVVVLDVPDIYDFGSPRIGPAISRAMGPWWSLVEELRAERPSGA